MHAGKAKNSICTALYHAAFYIYSFSYLFWIRTIYCCSRLFLTHTNTVHYGHQEWFVRTAIECSVVSNVALALPYSCCSSCHVPFTSQCSAPLTAPLLHFPYLTSVSPSITYFSKHRLSSSLRPNAPKHPKDKDIVRQHLNQPGVVPFVTLSPESSLSH